MFFSGGWAGGDRLRMHDADYIHSILPHAAPWLTVEGLWASGGRGDPGVHRTILAGHTLS